MAWIKHGIIFDPRNRFKWMRTHAQLPVAYPVNNQGNNPTGSIYRIYFACRDNKQRSQIGYVVINLDKPSEVIEISEYPVLRYGKMGYFDEHGVYPSSIITQDKNLYMYYIGWNKGSEPPMFYASIGLAVSEDGGKSFDKYSEAPILSRGEFDPWMVTAPFVLKEQKLFRMFYVSGIGWERDSVGVLRSFYHTKYAESLDGIHWTREGVVSIDFKDKDERNISRCCVLYENGIYKAYYSVNTRRSAYRLDYAESVDGMYFERKNNRLNILLSNCGFDSEMMAYPYVINYKDSKYMFYNGNRFGLEGIGLAIWKD